MRIEEAGEENLSLQKPKSDESRRRRFGPNQSEKKRRDTLLTIRSTLMGRTHRRRGSKPIRNESQRSDALCSNILRHKMIPG